MKTITIKFCLLFSLVFINNSFAQQDSLADVFPLRFGNKWTYSFNNYSYSMGHTSTTDTGTTEYQIISSITSLDSTSWKFRQTRNYTRYWYFNYTNYPPISMNDTSYFQIVEMNRGQHEIYLLTSDWGNEYYIHSVFPFWKYYVYSYNDSSIFSRYLHGDTTKDFIFSKYIGAMTSTQRDIYFRKDIGVIQSTGRISYYGIQGGWWSNNLISFSPSYIGPHLKFPRYITFSALTGIPTDTTITLTCNGTELVRIYSIISTNPSLKITPSFLVMGPMSDAVLSIKHTSPPNGTSLSKIIITSSSVTSPDTIDITIQGRMEAILKTNKQINFGQVFFSRRHLDTTISIINTGNIPLVVDSVNAPISSEWLAYPLLTWDFDRRFVNSGDTAFCKIGLELTARDRYQNTNFSIYSNSKSSPDVIHFSAPICGGAIIFGSHSLSFTADVNGLGGGVLYIVAVMADVIVQRGQPSNPAFKTPNDIPNPISADYHNHTYTDEIQFIPRTAGMHTGYIIYSSRSTEPNDIIPAIDTVWLSGIGMPITMSGESTIDFGSKAIGEYADNIIPISNLTGVPQNITREFLNFDSSFIVPTGPIGTVGPNASIFDTIHFAPKTLGNHAMSIRYMFDDGVTQTGPYKVIISGLCVSPQVVISATNINFGKVRIGEYHDTILTITNLNNIDLEIIRDFSVPDLSYRFALMPIGTIASNSTIFDTIRFNPQSHGNHSIIAIYRFKIGNFQIGPYGISISGYGEKSVITQYSLSQNYPNPFNPGTIISFDVPLTSFVSLKVFDLLGREVATLVNEEMRPGSYEKTFDGRGLASGVYLYKLQSGSFIQTKKLLLLR
ncbi:MAG: choice-of-anchor D domain-containing protein [Ignavibacteriales bacterium]|nr:choice-of-anchor D domain-containing protein [Ignavibacteriales bacterium]